MIDIDTSNRTEQRKFGLVMAAAVVVVSLVHWLIRGHYAVWMLYVAAAFLLPGLLYPPVLRPIFVVWIKFALALNWVMTRLLLSIVFFGMITPLRWFFALIGKDTLDRARDPNAQTYWQDAEEQPTDPKRYFRQY